MSKSNKLFLIAFLASIPFWISINLFQQNVETFFYEQQLAKKPLFYLNAQISNVIFPLPNQEEINNTVSASTVSAQAIKNLANIQISSQAVLVIEFKKEAGERILFQKNANQTMSVASLTKLINGLVVIKYYKPEQEIIISSRAVSQPEDTGWLKTGDVFRVDDLLNLSLIESSNDAAFALADMIGEPLFVDLMNLKAKELGLKNTHFSNAIGLDDDVASLLTNYSTAWDIKEIAKRVLANPDILDVLSQRELPLYSPEGWFHHSLKTTNQLLGEEPLVLAGKTGFTEKAGGCLLEILKTSQPDVFIIAVILGSQDRFSDMRQIIRALE